MPISSDFIPGEYASAYTVEFMGGIDIVEDQLTVSIQAGEVVGTGRQDEIGQTLTLRLNQQDGPEICGIFEEHRDDGTLAHSGKVEFVRDPIKGDFVGAWVMEGVGVSPRDQGTWILRSISKAATQVSPIASIAPALSE
jgi:hypothetical protein